MSEKNKVNAITQAEYKKHNESFWIGRKVRMLKKRRNGWWVIPVGFVLEITRKYKGFALEGVDDCETCGLGKRVSIGRVDPGALELLEE